MNGKDNGNGFTGQVSVIAHHFASFLMASVSDRAPLSNATAPACAVAALREWVGSLQE